MTTFYICRHGETENNKNQKLAGWLDAPLTGRGLENVQATFEKLRDVKFYQIQTSDLGRAVTTAELLAKGLGFDEEIVRSKDLREVNYGDWGGMSYKEATRRFPRSDLATDFTPPNGESLRDMQKRVVQYVNELSKSNLGQTILLVGHDGTIKAIYSYFASIDLGKHDTEHEYSHDFIAKFTIENGTITSFAEV